MRKISHTASYPLIMMSARASVDQRDRGVGPHDQQLAVVPVGPDAAEDRDRRPAGGTRTAPRASSRRRTGTSIVRYQNTAYCTSIEPNRLTVCPLRKRMTLRRPADGLLRGMRVDPRTIRRSAGARHGRPRVRRQRRHRRLTSRYIASVTLAQNGTRDISRSLPATADRLVRGSAELRPAAPGRRRASAPMRAAASSAESPRTSR